MCIQPMTNNALLCNGREASRILEAIWSTWEGQIKRSTDGRVDSVPDSSHRDPGSSPTGEGNLCLWTCTYQCT